MIFPLQVAPRKTVLLLELSIRLPSTMFQAHFSEDFKAFGFFFSLLDPENIYLLALLF